MLNFLQFMLMASQHIKRPRPNLQDSDSDEDRVIETFPKFIVLTADNDLEPLSKMSPFIIEKALKGIIGDPKSVKKLRNGSLLVEVNRKPQSDQLLNCNKLFTTDITASPHKSLNFSKGVIKGRILAGVSSRK